MFESTLIYYFSFFLLKNNCFTVPFAVILLTKFTLNLIKKSFFCPTIFFLSYYFDIRYSLMAQTVKNVSAVQGTLFDPWVGKIPWRREWLPTPYCLTGEFHGQRGLVGYSPWGGKESDTIKLD